MFSFEQKLLKYFSFIVRLLSLFAYVFDLPFSFLSSRAHSKESILLSWHHSSKALA